PISESKEKKLRSELDKLFSSSGKGGFGNRYFGSNNKDDSSHYTANSEDEDFYSYVYLTLQPFSVLTSAAAAARSS
ncbi:vacuolar atp synthase subunit c, partial [Cystoisospora suis]